MDLRRLNDGAALRDLNRQQNGSHHFGLCRSASEALPPVFRQAVSVVAAGGRPEPQTKTIRYQ
jgi:hypothetical protein